MDQLLLAGLPPLPSESALVQLALNSGLHPDEYKVFKFDPAPLTLP